MNTERDIELTAITARSAVALLTPGEVHYALPSPVRWSLRRNGRVVDGGRSATVAVFLDGLEPAADYELELLDRAVSAGFRTRDCAGVVDAAVFGARPDGRDNAAAFAAAVEAVPEGGTLLVPAGRYNSAPIFLKSDMTLHLAAGATLAATGDRAMCPVLGAERADGRMLGSWEGLPEASFASLLTAIDCRNLAITGSGIIDGGGDRGDWWDWPKETRDGARRPRTIFLNGCEGVVLSGPTVRNSPSWTIHPLYCRDVTVAALHIQNPPDSPNTDGLNPECCEDVAVEGVRFSVGDDCIAIKAGKRGAGRTAHLAPTRRVRVRNCLMERGHGAVVIGSEMSGGVTGIDIRRCEFVGTDRGLRIKTRRGRGGEVSGVSLTDCRMKRVDTPLAVNAFYFCDADGRSEAVQSRAPTPVDETTPRLFDIRVARLRAEGVRSAVGAFLGLPEAQVGGIRLEEVSADFDPEAGEAAPLMACDVPPMRHVRVYAEYAEVQGEILTPAPMEDVEG